jgi:hypothetical protein
LRLKLLRVAFWALGFLFAVDQRFELMMAFLADVFVDWHIDSYFQGLKPLTTSLATATVSLKGALPQ